MPPRWMIKPTYQRDAKGIDFFVLSVSSMPRQAVYASRLPAASIPPPPLPPPFLPCASFCFPTCMHAVWLFLFFIFVFLFTAFADIFFGLFLYVFPPNVSSTYFAFCLPLSVSPTLSLALFQSLPPTLCVTLFPR